jgi:formate transporter FocA
MSNDAMNSALVPAEMAQKAEEIGIKKANSSAFNLFSLGVLAGAFVAIGAFFSTTVSAGTSTVPYGIVRLLMGLAFSVGLVLVVVGGAELFTGNTLIMMAWASKKVSTLQLLRNWTIVYFGNFAGSVATAVIVFLSGQYTFGGGAVGRAVLTIATSKMHYGFVQAIFLGVLCNALVCLAVWLTYSARTTGDKILAIVFPISAFVAAGFEHSVANMYFVPMGLFIRQFNPEFALKIATDAGLDLASLNWGTFLVNNLLPVTIGNIIGGGVMVGMVYWMIYLRKSSG